MSNTNSKKSITLPPYLIPIWTKKIKNYKQSEKYNNDLYRFFLLQHQIILEVGPTPFYDFCKRCFDLIFSIIALIFFSPILCFVAILIKLDSDGPIFFFQERSGKHLHIFRMIKFRTMVEDADIETRLLLEKEITDSRSTRVGRVLRKWKLDELPQLFNIITGQMSLVGPRPFPLEESVFVDRVFIKRFGVLPGLTGLWQATEFNTISAFEKFRLDSVYVEKRSFFYDLFLILRTIPRVLNGESPKIDNINPDTVIHNKAS